MYEWILQSYFDLSTCRGSGGMGGAMPIPWTAIVQYADRNGLDDMFVEIIMQSDVVLLSHANKKNDAQIRSVGSDADQDRKAGNPARP